MRFSAERFHQPNTDSDLPLGVIPTTKIKNKNKQHWFKQNQESAYQWNIVVNISPLPAAILRKSEFTTNRLVVTSKIIEQLTYLAKFVFYQKNFLIYLILGKSLIVEKSVFCLCVLAENFWTIWTNQKK